MVTMQVGNKDVTDFGETNARTAKLHLCALAAVNHKQLVANLHNLCRCIMAKCGECAAAS